MKNICHSCKPFRRRTLPLVIGCLCLPALVNAQSSSERIDEETLVVGQAASLNEALEDQRKASNVKTVVNADAIGQFPDANVSEALQRLPGLSIERDQGEGRFVRVRGLGPNLNAVSINGVHIPSPESGSRAVALDVIPSDLLDSLEVSKTLTPDMPADSLGGSINVKSISAFDREDAYYSLSLEGSFDELTSETSPKGAIAGSERFGREGEEKFGVAGALSWFERDFGSDNVETGGAWAFEDEGALLEEMEQRDYTITRERTGAALNFDFRPSDDTQLYFRNLYSEYTDSEIRLGNIYEFADGDGLLAGEAGVAAMERELKDRTETLKIFSSSVGGSTTMDHWQFDYAVSYSKSSEKTPYHMAAAIFETEDLADVSFSGTRIPQPSLPSGFAWEFELDEVEMAEHTTTDRENSLNLDALRETSWGSFKFGTKLARRDKDSDENIWIYEDFDEAGIDEARLDMSQYTAGNVEHEQANMGPALSSAGLKAMVGEMDAAAFWSEEDSRIADFEMSEDTNAAYVMATWELPNLQLLGGARYEATDMSAQGTAVVDGEYQAVDVENDYSHILPSLHARYTLGESTQVRAAWSNSVVRPTFEQLAPGFVIEGDEASFGNPDLDALESMNFDLGIEHYMGYASMVSAFGFYKDIENFVYLTDLGGTAGFEDYDQAETFRNGDAAKVYGLELAYYKQFQELPAPWNGVLVGANGTWTDSEANISYADEGELDSRTIAFPSQSDMSYNLMLGYENEKVSLRLSANSKSEYLVEVGDFGDPAGDIYAEDHMQIDFLARYYITDNLQVYLHGINLNDESYYTYAGESAFNAQYEEYGPTFKLGFSISNF